MWKLRPVRARVFRWKPKSCHPAATRGAPTLGHRQLPQAPPATPEVKLIQMDTVRSVRKGWRGLSRRLPLAKNSGSGEASFVMEHEDTAGCPSLAASFGRGLGTTYGHVGFTASIHCLGHGIHQVTTDPKVTHLHVALLVDKDVGRLHICQR